MIKLRGRIKFAKGTSYDWDMLSDDIEKAWDARGVEDILENDELAKGIEEVSIRVEVETELGTNTPYYCIELKTTEEFFDDNYDAIMSCLTFEIGYGINEFIMGLDNYKGVTFVSSPMEEM